MFLQHFPQDTAKLIFFENLFYMLDSDSNGLILIEETFFWKHWSRLVLHGEECKNGCSYGYPGILAPQGEST